MDKQESLFGKALVMVLIILLIGTSIVSSNTSIDEDNETYTQILDTEESSEELFRSNYGYAYNAYPGPECTVYFPLDNLSIIEECGDTISEDFLKGGAIDENGIWYASQYGSGKLYGIDTNNGCYMWPIGGGGQGLNDLAWDDCTSTLYGNSGSAFYEIDSEDGEQTYIGSSGIQFKGIAFNSNCICYGVDFNYITNNLYIINFSSFNLTFVATLINISLFSYCSLEFDKDYDILYLLIGNDLYTIDTDNGWCTVVYDDGFEGGADLTAFVIPYEYYDIPPVTTHTLDPPEPNGENGWYVSDVNITLNATDDQSGVKEIRYTINGGAEQVILGGSGSFILSEDGNDILVDYWAIDNAGNVEPKNSIIIDIDQTVPAISLTYEFIGGNRWQGWDILLGVTASDLMSGMDRVEFYYNDELQEIINGSGPEYKCEVKMYISDFDFYSFFVRGLICNLEINEEFVNFYSIFTFIRVLDWDGSPQIYAIGYDLAGNYEVDEIDHPCNSIDISPGLYLFQNLTLPNNYTGHIGKFFISATFDSN